MAYHQNVQYLSLAFWQIIMTAGPILAIALGIGLLIGLIQAATSIQEMTLSFVPKLVIVIIYFCLLSNFILTQLPDYFGFIFDQISRYYQLQALPESAGGGSGVCEGGLSV